MPTQVRVSYLKSRSAFLYWSAAEDYEESRITYYIVHLIKIHENATSEKPKIQTWLANSPLVVKLSNLSEFTEYSVQVAAVNNLTRSSFTEKVNFTTLRKYIQTVCIQCTQCYLPTDKCGFILLAKFFFIFVFKSRQLLHCFIESANIDLKGELCII